MPAAAPSPISTSPEPPKPGDREPLSDPELEDLRRLLFGDDWPRLSSLSRRIGTEELFSNELARVLSRAILLAAQHDKRLRQALQPVVEESLLVFARREPRALATILFPAIGSAIRRAMGAYMNALIESLTVTIEQSFSMRGLKWRMESWRTGKPIGAIVLARSRLFRVEQVFLIHRPSGILLCQRSAPDAKGADPDMVSGMLTAITDFVSDSFGPSEHQEVGSIQVDDYRIWIVNAPNALLAAVVRGPAPFEIHSRLREALEEIHSQLSQQLLSFTGDTAPFHAAAPVLDRCLFGQAGAAERRNPMTPWILLGAVILALLGAFGLFRYRENQRWERFLGELKGQPGLVITEVERGWTRSVVSGLRDPLAGSPDRIAESHGYFADQVDFRWRSFLSLDPPIVAARELRSLRESIEARQIRFDTNSAVLQASQYGVLAELANVIDRLHQLARRNQRRVLVEVLGEADSTGDAARNVRLAGDRAEAVSRVLGSSGAPMEVLAHKSRTVETGSTTYPRVTFRVSEVPAP